MSLFPDPQHTPRARRSDPGTSHEAAASVENLTEKQVAVIRALERLGGEATDTTIADIYTVASTKWRSLFPRQSPSGLRTRRAELFAAGMVVDTGRRATLATGRQAIVWALAPDVRSAGLRRG